MTKEEIVNALGTILDMIKDNEHSDAYMLGVVDMLIQGLIEKIHNEL